LALVQGITEFLPVSAAGHRAMTMPLLGWTDPGLAVDIAVRIGTLLAVMLYFWRDLWFMAVGVIRRFSGRREAGARMAAQIVAGTLPLVVGGYAVSRYLPSGPQGLLVVGWAMLGFGVVLFLADRIGMTIRRVEHLGYADAIIIGVVQVLSLVPGASRSGVAMSAARILGFERVDAARFSMLLSIPAIIGGIAFKGVGIFGSDDGVFTASALFAAALSFVAAFAGIAFLMTWLRRSTFTPFVVYRILLGGTLLGLAYGWGL